MRTISLAFFVSRASRARHSVTAMIRRNKRFYRSLLTDRTILPRCDGYKGDRAEMTIRGGIPAQQLTQSDRYRCPRVSYVSSIPYSVQDEKRR
jgi:hypothetical protein